MTRPFERARAAFGDVRAASPRELYWRGWIGLASVLGLRQRRFTPPQPTAFRAALPTAVRDPHALQDWLRQRPSSFLFDPAQRDHYRPRLAPLFTSHARAEALLEDAILLFGRPVRTSDPWDWHADPVSGTRWIASRHWTRQSVVGPPGADVRRVWERNRHRDLFVLGRAYWATGDERFAESAAERLDRWYGANPPELGINWWSNLEVAVRAIAWVWAVHFFRDARAFTGPRLWELVGHCWLAGWHLERDLQHSIRTMAGNHVIGDAAGLAVIALALPELAESTRWRRTALSTLEREAHAQVAPDGTHREESPSYHAFVWELLCQVALLARKQGIEMPNTWAALPRMAESLLLVARPDGSLPASGDDDAAVGFDLSEGGSRSFAIASAAAVLFDRPDLKAPVEAADESLLWLAGPEGLDAWAALPAADGPTPRVTGFGLAVRSSWNANADWWFLRGGTQSRHTHADALHLEIAVGGEVLLEDTGTGSYSASVEWRRHARGTRAHNTVALDGRDQAVMHRTFRWLSPLHVDWRRAGPSDGGWYADAVHDGYRDGAIRHRRCVWWRPDWGWLVLDHLEGRGDHDVEIRWHTRASVARAERGVRISGAGGAALHVVTSPPLALEIETAVDVDGGLDAWIASDYTTLVPGTVVTARARLPFPAHLATLLCSSADAEHATVSLDSTSAGLRVRLRALDRVLDLAADGGGRDVDGPRERA